MDLRLSIAFRPQTYGQSEVTIHVLENLLWQYVDYTRIYGTSA